MLGALVAHTCGKGFVEVQLLLIVWIECPTALVAGVKSTNLLDYILENTVLNKVFVGCKTAFLCLPVHLTNLGIPMSATSNQ